MALQLIEKVYPDPDSNKTNHGWATCLFMWRVHGSGGLAVDQTVTDPQQPLFPTYSHT